MYLFFFFNDTATTEIYPLSLHDALPICLQDRRPRGGHRARPRRRPGPRRRPVARAVRVRLERAVPAVPRPGAGPRRSEEHTSELQSQSNLVCRLLLEKKKKKSQIRHIII